MPQMSPMDWFMLYMYMLLIYFLILVLIFFFYTFKDDISSKEMKLIDDFIIDW